MSGSAPYQWTVRCDAPGCAQSVARQTGRRSFPTVVELEQAARALLWLGVRIDGHPVWACPLHQKYDEAAARWIPDLERRTAA